MYTIGNWTPSENVTNIFIFFFNLQTPPPILLKMFQKNKKFEYQIYFWKLQKNYSLDGFNEVLVVQVFDK